MNKIRVSIKYINFAFLFFIFLFFIINLNFSLPIEAIPDEVAQLKNIYAMINSKSLFLTYQSSYSVWTHYTYIIPTLIYWIFFYIFSDLLSINELKFYILNNYQDVLPFLRLYTAMVFLIGLYLIKIVIDNLLNKIQALLFLIFIGFNLLIVINVHYAKHWMMDYGLIFIALYLYYIYSINNNNKVILLFSFITFAIASFSTQLFIIYSFYFLLIDILLKKESKKIIFNILIFISILIIFFFITRYLGAGGVFEGKENKLSELLFSNNYFIDIVYIFYDYNTIVFILFIMSLVFLAIKNRYFTILISLIPFLLMLVIVSVFSHFETRYAIPFMIESSFIATFFAYYLYQYYKKIFYVFIILYIFANSYLIINWLNIISNKDTRVLTREWILEQDMTNNFYIYNTLGFNYVALTKHSIDFIKSNFPKAIGTREEMHINYNLNDGKDGLILWKFDQAGYNIVELINKLKENGYKIIFINERHGKIALHYQPSPNSYETFVKSFNPTMIKEFLPYKKEPKDRELIGDVLYNFNYVWQTLNILERSGPVINIYEVK